ncbi:phosphoserine transaminase [Parvularcula lutaonensis]|uniref:phosphoserine transaminase n=1 Tax=Parvularcula lutaonensis TaxID=491923 RepID=A0ABV7MEN7_9PROT|nr:phosphoserine transaminase [Parvularcula lutaonensis]GGY51006.1 phosphoserine aminotransferase [Parvularcula lutaonensis]
MEQPTRRPAQPSFSSGPCAKRPGWSPACLSSPTLGRSHRSSIGKARLKEAIDKTRAVLEVPASHLIGIVPASDTGAVEIAMWNLLGARPVTTLAWESFGLDWVKDAVDELSLSPTVLQADYGDIPDLTKVDQGHDIVFTWNGTTSGVRVPHADWISDDREGLTICDATSAAFAQDLPWEKLDVVTYSWQKVLGGEAQHGILILGPRAIERINSYQPEWPLPKIFRLKKKGQLNEGIFRGETINTPSMLCVEDYIDALEWAESLGGLSALKARADANLEALESWVGRTGWVDFLAEKPIRSNTSVCLKVTDQRVAALPAEEQQAFIKRMTKRLADAEAAYDIAGYRAAPPGLRIWCGATVETADIEALTPWLDWAFAAEAETL